MRVKQVCATQLLIESYNILCYVSAALVLLFGSVCIFVYFHWTGPQLILLEPYWASLVLGLLTIPAALFLIFEGSQINRALFDLDKGEVTLSHGWISPEWEARLGFASHIYTEKLDVIIDCFVEQSYFIDVMLNEPSFRLVLLLRSGQMLPVFPSFSVNYALKHRDRLTKLSLRIKSFLGISNPSDIGYIWPQEREDDFPDPTDVLKKVSSSAASNDDTCLWRSAYPPAKEREKMHFSKKRPKEGAPLGEYSAVASVESQSQYNAMYPVTPVREEDSATAFMEALPRESYAHRDAESSLETDSPRMKNQNRSGDTEDISNQV